jgi:hypothetical protein
MRLFIGRQNHWQLIGKKVNVENRHFRVQLAYRRLFVEVKFQRRVRFDLSRNPGTPPKKV